MQFVEKLKLYKNFEISKEKLYEGLPRKPFSYKSGSMVFIGNKDVINLLNKYNSKIISKKEVLDWVNIIWFSDWYNYLDENSDCISAVLSELEELDETDRVLTKDKIKFYISALERNQEI